MNKKLKWILLSLGLVVLIFLAVRATMNRGDEGTRVTAETVKRRTITETVSASGKLYPETEIKIGSPIAGELTQLLVQEGDSVKKGQVIGRVQGERMGAAPQRVTIPNVPPGFESLVQSMQPPRVSSGPSAATITAPISGTVTGLNVKQGERIGAMQMPGGELMRIADMRNIEVRVDVNENNIIKISVGDSAEVEVEAYNRRKFKGVVTAIGSAGAKRDAQSFLSNDVTSYEVHVRLLASSYEDLFDTSRRRVMPFRAGMNARADIKTQKREGVLSIPVGAVVSKPKGSEENREEEKGQESRDAQSFEEETAVTDELEEVVYVLKEDGTVERRTVTTGIQDITYFEITGGLQEGEQVVTGPYAAVSKNLRTGGKVTVVPREKLFQKD